MNTGNLALLAVISTVLLITMERTEKKRRWVTVIFLVAPISILLYRWAIYRGQTTEAMLAAAVGMTLFGLFWWFYGRRNPPLSSDEAITVIGGEENLLRAPKRPPKPEPPKSEGDTH